MKNRLFPDVSQKKLNPNSVIITGVPFDLTESFRRGAAKGPDAIRRFSLSIESNSKKLNRDIENIDFYDAGNISVKNSSTPDMIRIVRNFIKKYNKNQVLCLGGDHLVSYPFIFEIARKFKDVVVLHIDAHTDLREKWLNKKFTHCTVMRRIIEDCGNCHLIQTGIRSGTKQEFEFIKDHPRIHSFELEDTPLICRLIGSRPVYLTLDLDVLDPSVVPGVCNPEPGGAMFNELLNFLHYLIPKVSLMGADVVELAPGFDASGVSSATAASIVRDILLCWK
ncbi:MAG: agmatinase [bacterium]